MVGKDAEDGLGAEEEKRGGERMTAFRYGGPAPFTKAY